MSDDRWTSERNCRDASTPVSGSTPPPSSIPRRYRYARVISTLPPDSSRTHGLAAEFSPAVGAWFDASFAAPTAVQAAGWEAIARGDHALLLAPTGSGKTLAAFLWAVDRLATSPEPSSPQCRVVYISPLKAL